MMSIHLNRACPHTTMHDSCSPCANKVSPECIHLHDAYDCTCSTQRLYTCDFMHLTLVEKKFARNVGRLFDKSDLMCWQSEPTFIANAQ